MILFKKVNIVDFYFVVNFYCELSSWTLAASFLIEAQRGFRRDSTTLGPKRKDIFVLAILYLIMTEGKSSEKPAKNLLALNPKEEAEFQKKVQQVKNRPKKVWRLTMCLEFSTAIIYLHVEKWFKLHLKFI